MLGYYEGIEYLRAQLRTIFVQIEVEVEVFIFDDCSPSGEIDIDALGLSESDKDRLHIIRRETNLGFSKNFLTGLSECPDSFNFYAYSDQDDLWDSDKLIVAIRELEKRFHEVPVLYCSRTRIVAECGEGVKGLSPLFQKAPSFAGSLVQNIGGGNTMVFNAPAKRVINQFSEGIQVVSHDWWSYIAVTAVGGEVIYDPVPHIAYRQHSDNIVGANSSFKARLSRIKMLLSGRFKDWGDVHTKSLQSKLNLLTPINQKTLNAFVKARSHYGFRSYFDLRRHSIERQTFAGELGLAIATLFRKI